MPPSPEASRCRHFNLLWGVLAVHIRQGLNSRVEALAPPTRRYKICGCLCRQSARSLIQRQCAHSLPANQTHVRITLERGGRESIPAPAEPKRKHATKSFFFFPVRTRRSIVDFSGVVLVLAGQKKLTMTRRGVCALLSPPHLSALSPISRPADALALVPLFVSIAFVHTSVRKRRPSLRRWFSLGRQTSCEGGGARVQFYSRRANLPQVGNSCASRPGLTRPLTPLCRRYHKTHSHRRERGGWTGGKDP
jgi:hypothetical protein